MLLEARETPFGQWQIYQKTVFTGTACVSYYKGHITTIKKCLAV